ncbi:MAG: hypothetical protein EOP83_32410 [Verrucomicrobiaceae bacterium]|nr:MAG: hypothetical protein EOP83_32410 [Verrucomicrobiaceae bacterium]
MGKFSIRHREPDDAAIYFTDNDTALTCLLLFGEIPRSTSSEMGMYPYAVAYRGSRAVQTIGELRDWLNELPERSWSLETEKMISPDTFVVKNVIVIRFASRDEAFSFKLRWHAAI